VETSRLLFISKVTHRNAPTVITTTITITRQVTTMGELFEGV